MRKIQSQKAFQPGYKQNSNQNSQASSTIANRISGNYQPSDDAKKQPRMKAYSSHQNHNNLQNYNSSRNNNQKYNYNSNYSSNNPKTPVQQKFLSTKKPQTSSAKSLGLSSYSSLGGKSFEFQKMPDKRKNGLYKDWDQYISQGEWMKKKQRDISPIRFVLTSDKQFENTERSITPISQRYEESRKRDFSSQIKTLPGPQNNGQRQLIERPTTPERYVHPINKKIQESTYFQASKEQQKSNKENITSQYSSYQKTVKDFQPKNNLYSIKEFLYRTPRDFLTTNLKK